MSQSHRSDAVDPSVQDWIQGLISTQDGSVGDYAEPLEKAEARAESRRERNRRHCGYQDAIDPGGYGKPLTKWEMGKDFLETLSAPNGCFLFGKGRWRMFKEHRADLLLFNDEVCRNEGLQLWHTVITAGIRAPIEEAVQQLRAAKEKLKGLNKGRLFKSFRFELIAVFEHTNPLRWIDGTMTLAIHYHCILVKHPGISQEGSYDLGQMLGGRLPGIALELAPVRNLKALLNYSMKEEPGLRQCSPEEVARIYRAFGKKHAPFARYGSFRNFVIELRRNRERAEFNQQNGFVDRVPVNSCPPRNGQNADDDAPRVVKILPVTQGSGGLMELPVCLRGDCTDRERIFRENPQLKDLQIAASERYAKGIGKAVVTKIAQSCLNGDQVNAAEMVSRYLGW